MSVIKINKENFASEVLNSNKPVLLDFYADWCGPCRMVGPIVSEIANERSDVKVGKNKCGRTAGTCSTVSGNEHPDACCNQKRETRKSGCWLQIERAN